MPKNTESFVLIMDSEKPAKGVELANPGLAAALASKSDPEVRQASDTWVFNADNGRANIYVAGSEQGAG